MTVFATDPLGPSQNAVDAAVRSVLAEILTPTTLKIRTPKSDPTQPSFTGRLLSLRHAEELSAHVCEVRVAPGTVVTPLARELLKHRAIAVRVVSRGDLERVETAGEWLFAIDTESGLVEAFRRTLRDGQDAWRELDSSLDSVAHWASEAEGRGALFLSDEASVAVYRACQFPNVRAAQAEEPDSVARAVQTLGINLLVVEPAGKSIAMLRQIAQTFRRGGGPRRPAWLEGVVR